MALSAEAVQAIAAAIRKHEVEAPGGDGHDTSLQEVLRTAGSNRAAEVQCFVERLTVLSDEERWGLDDALDEVQMASKLWLIDELTKVTDLAGQRLVVLGAWYGILPLLINWRVDHPPERTICVDIDAKVSSAGERLIGALYDNVEYRVTDAMTFDYEESVQNRYAVVINTICEHLPRFGHWWKRIPDGQFLVLQSNNYFLCPDHVNAVETLDELKQQAPMSEVRFQGALPLLKWKRFMLIGSK